MPIPTPKPIESSLFPTLTREQIDATRTSSWHETFREVTTPCTLVVLGALGEDEEFIRWLDADSIFLPEGSQFPDLPQNGEPGPSTRESRSRSSSTSSSATDSSGSSGVPPVYKLPKSNDAIRNAIMQHGGAVFPKLNWTAPKDAAFILPQTANGPLHCTSPADVYLLIKSSDFISHSVDPERAYAFGDDTALPAEEPLNTSASSASDLKQSPKLELVLKQHVQIVPSREVRCFVRNNILLGICQRDNNFYDHLQKPEAQESVRDNVKAFWEDEIRDQHQALGQNYVFDIYLDSSLEDAQIIDINPYRGSTDPLLFTYPELLSILEQAQQPIYSDSTAERPRLPILKVIDSASHPEATRPAPTFGGNMMPLEMIEMSQGRSMEEFREVWEEAVARGMT